MTCENIVNGYEWHVLMFKTALISIRYDDQDLACLRPVSRPGTRIKLYLACRFMAKIRAMCPSFR